MAKQKMKTVDMSTSIEEMEAKEKKAKAPKIEEGTEVTEGEEAVVEEGKVYRARVRSSKYHAVKSRVDRTISYPALKAVELMQKTSYAKFTSTVVADLLVRDDKVSVDVTFPYSTGKVIRVAVATEELLAKVEKGEIDFDILVTSPALMPKIARLAKILGPKGLMPNPKNGTVAADPEKRAKELSSGKVTIKTERKAPLIHAIIGKANQPAKELVGNIEALVKAISTGKILKLTISSTMSPGIKVDISKLGE